jgi:hypothetical protein
LTSLTLSGITTHVSDIAVKWTEPDRIDDRDQQMVMSKIDRELEKFSDYLQGAEIGVAQGPLTKAERVLMRTYLVAKLRGKI